jgi:nitroimidazol reductase NimA-like FMN-containing flavoprotein (pyridoxamine 5'-phosphate oxidase superfamily)
MGATSGMGEGESPDAWLEELGYEECLRLLRGDSVGRIAVVVDDFPVVLPVNYRLVETSAVTWVALRTRPGSVIDRAPLHAAFEIDEIDRGTRQGWSVLVRGTLHHVDADAADFRARFDSEPWVAAEREAWLVIQPFAISGRRLHPAAPDWAFHARAYL